MTETIPSVCPRCGIPVEDGTAGLCPRCLLAMSLRTRTLPTGTPVGSAAAPPPSLEEMAGKFPQFEFLDYLGRGGMGIVYKARQKALDRLVAIKILAGEWQQEPGFAERFSREARTLAKLAHPHIVTVHDFGEADGLYYLVMEFIDGVNLRDLLRDGCLEPQQALAIVPPVCEALQYAHSHGVVHRDIKPENLLLDREGRVKIADFGIAMLAGDDPDAAGTPAYMAPEQSRAGDEIDHRVDIYALGVVLYEMLTGERPTAEDPPVAQILVDVRIDEVVLRALASRPEMRFQSATEMATAIRTVVTDPATEARARPVARVPEIRVSKWAVAGFIWLMIGLSGWTLGLTKRYPEAVYRELLNHFVPSSFAPRKPEDRIRKMASHSMFPEPAPGGSVPAPLALFVLMAIPGPIGGMACGWMAVRRISRSRGLVYGLGLALFDALLIPCAASAAGLWFWLPNWNGIFNRMAGHPPIPSYVFLVVLIPLFVAFQIGEVLTRGMMQPRQKSGPFVWGWRIVGTALALGAIGLLPSAGLLTLIVCETGPHSSEWGQSPLWIAGVWKWRWMCLFMLAMAAGAAVCGMKIIRGIRNRDMEEGMTLAVGIITAFPLLLTTLLLWWGWSRLLSPLSNPHPALAWMAPWAALLTAGPIGWALVRRVRQYGKTAGEKVQDHESEAPASA